MKQRRLSNSQFIGSLTTDVGISEEGMRERERRSGEHLISVHVYIDDILVIISNKIRLEHLLYSNISHSRFVLLVHEI